MCRLEVSELQTRLAEIQEEVCSPRAGFLQVAVRVQTRSMVNDASNLKVVLHLKKKKNILYRKRIKPWIPWFAVFGHVCLFILNP